MSSLAQEYGFTDPVEVVNTAPEVTWTQIVQGWATDLWQQDIPASVVVLLVIVIYLPKVFGLVRLWFTRGVR